MTFTVSDLSEEYVLGLVITSESELKVVIAGNIYKWFDSIFSNLRFLVSGWITANDPILIIIPWIIIILLFNTNDYEIIFQQVYESDQLGKPCKIDSEIKYKSGAPCSKIEKWNNRMLSVDLPNMQQGRQESKLEKWGNHWYFSWKTMPQFIIKKHREILWKIDPDFEVKKPSIRIITSTICNYLVMIANERGVKSANEGITWISKGTIIPDPPNAQTIWKI